MQVADTKVADLTVGNVLDNTKYKIDYYQRAYSWGEQEVIDLLDDLLGKFFNSYTEGDETTDVARYGQYFLGSFVLSISGGDKYIIDGQQRLTTLTLIYMYFFSLGMDAKKYIYSDPWGEANWNIYSPERDVIMQGVTDYSEGKPVSKEISEHNIFKRYNDIAQIMSERLSKDTREHFFYWLSGRVVMVKIEAYSNHEAYTIFETMNDRGKPLTTLEMLKGFLLSSVPTEQRTEATLHWNSIAKKVPEMDVFLKNVIKGRFGQSSYKSGGTDSDWGRISASPHRWLRENPKLTGISSKHDYFQFIKDLNYYADLHVKIERYKTSIVPGKEDVCYLAMKGMPNLDAILYSAINPNDEFENEKISATCRFLDIYTADQIWAGVDYNQPSNSTNTAITLMKKIRTPENDIDLFVYKLVKELESVTFEGSPTLRPQARYRNHMKSILFRLTSFMDMADNKPETWKSLWDDKYEIEHLLATNYEANKDFINSEEELNQFRDSIGSLGVLDKNTNSSFGDMPYREKVMKYDDHNRLIGILSPKWYDSDNRFVNHPGLTQLVHRHPQLKDLMVPYPEKFTRNESRKRTELYRELSKIVWDVSRLLEYTSCYDFKELDDYVKQEYYDTGKLSYEEDESNKYSYYIPNQGGGAYTEIEILEDGRIMLLKLNNARTPSLLSPAAKIQITSKIIKKIYDEVEKTMRVNGSGYYNWEGSVEIPRQYMAVFLLAGYSGSSDQWVRM